MSMKRRIFMVCDRSAGHIFPALAVAKAIMRKDPGAAIYFFATSDFLKEYISREGFVAHGKSFVSRNLPVEIVYRFFEAVYLLVKFRPYKLIGFGGRDSFFLMLISSILLRDTSIYEPNAKCGKANKLLSFFVGKVLYGFNREKASDKCVSIGIPLRPSISKIPRQEALRMIGLEDKPTISCFGGSQGSVFLNDIFVKLVSELKGDFQVIHLTGKREYFKISQFYNTMNKKSFVKDFYYQMEILYSASDMVICRCGASTLGEIAYYNLPAIIVPHPNAGGHQKENALYFSRKGAACMFSQDSLDFGEFKRVAEDLLYEEGLRKKIKNNLKDIKIGIAFEDFCKNNCF